MITPVYQVSAQDLGATTIYSNAITQMYSATATSGAAKATEGLLWEDIMQSQAGSFNGSLKDVESTTVPREEQPMCRPPWWQSHAWPRRQSRVIRLGTMLPNACVCGVPRKRTPTATPGINERHLNQPEGHQQRRRHLRGMLLPATRAFKRS